MKSRIASRGPQIDTELCVANSGDGRFAMIIAASARAREIRRHNKESNKFEHIHPIVTALLEIQDGTLNTQEYIKKVKFNEPRDHRIDRQAKYNR
jgi:DNA-directed RNA polymerase subunit K/omega